MHFSDRLMPPLGTAIPSVCLSSVCPWQIGSLPKRWKIGPWLLKPPLGYSGDPSPTTQLWPPFPTNWAHNPQLKLASQTAAKRRQMYWQPMGTYNRPTQRYHRRPPSQNGVVKKLNSKLLQNRNRYLRAL